MTIALALLPHGTASLLGLETLRLGIGALANREHPQLERAKGIRRMSEIGGVMRLFQLPRDVSHTTMDSLIGKGLVIPLSANRGRFSMDYGWQLFKEADYCLTTASK